MTGSFFIFRDEIQCVLKKGLFLSRLEKLLIRAVRAVCQDPGYRLLINAHRSLSPCLFLFRQRLWLTFDEIHYLLIRQPPDQLRNTLFPRLICYLPYILLA